MISFEIVTVLRSHLRLPGVSSNVSRLRLIYSFAVLPASNSVFVCVATFIIATRFRGVKQIGFYPNILEQQLVSWCFNFHCCACDVILFHLSASDWCASSAWTLTFWFRAVWLRNLAHPRPPFWLFLLWNRSRHFFLGVGGFSSPISSRPKWLRLFFYERIQFDRCSYASVTWQRWHFSTFAVKKRGALHSGCLHVLQLLL